jgi:hypothetical protein
VQITYEITATVEPRLAGEYEAYMVTRHIPDVLATGYFMSATFSRVGDRYRVRYEAASQETLEKYLETGAGRLRADFAGHFPAGIELSRENWEVLSTHNPPV